MASDYIECQTGEQQKCISSEEDFDFFVSKSCISSKEDFDFFVSKKCISSKWGLISLSAKMCFKRGFDFFANHAFLTIRGTPVSQHIWCCLGGHS